MKRYLVTACAIELLVIHSASAQSTLELLVKEGHSYSDGRGCQRRAWTP